MTRHVAPPTWSVSGTRRTLRTSGDGARGGGGGCSVLHRASRRSIVRHVLRPIRPFVNDRVHELECAIRVQLVAIFLLEFRAMLVVLGRRLLEIVLAEVFTFLVYNL